MTLNDVTVTWRQIVDVTHPGLNTHLGLNTCKYSAWSRWIYSVDIDLWKLHLLRWRHVTLDDVIVTRPLIVDATHTGLNTYKVCLNMINIWSWCQEVWILARKRKFEKEKQRNNLTFREHRKQRSDDFDVAQVLIYQMPKYEHHSCTVLFNEIQWIEKCNF